LEFEIDNKELLKLYKTGKSKKYRLQPTVLEKFFMRIQQIESAHNPDLSGQIRNDNRMA